MVDCRDGRLSFFSFSSCFDTSLHSEKFGSGRPCVYMFGSWNKRGFGGSGDHGGL